MKTRFLQIVVVSDYHELDLICDAFVGLELSNREIGTTITNSGLKYVGVVFDGCSPGDGELFDAISESGVIMETEDEPKKLKKPKCTKRKT